jgi:glycosyltransferase involved in cell wall biosynthesis
MKILWVKSDFLHPTTRGAVIRTLETLRRLHRRHEIHYVALNDPSVPEGLAQSGEYCSQAYPIPHSVPEKTSPAFAAQLLGGLISPLPVAVSRYRSPAMKEQIRQLITSQRFDSLVCDFLFPAPNIPDLSRCVLFQHNVESMIWRRRVEQTAGIAARSYIAMQARRMEAYERSVCQSAGHVIAVSANDAGTMREEFGATRVTEVSTGVDIDYFAPPPAAETRADIVFTGSMDWEANIDGAEFFVREVLPLIRRKRPQTVFAVVGRKPATRVHKLAEGDSQIVITGTVPDIRPWLWGAALSIVPLRIGGGTRLKIYESMAARVPVVSTSVGYEGLPVTPGRHLAVADTAKEFAARCLCLLEDNQQRLAMAEAAHALVAERFSWENVACQFEEILRTAPRPW